MANYLQSFDVYLRSLQQHLSIVVLAVILFVRLAKKKF